MHPSQLLTEVLCVLTVGFYGFTADFSKVGLGNRTTRCCNRVHLESFGFGGVVTVTNPVAIYLQDLDRGEV